MYVKEFSAEGPRTTVGVENIALNGQLVLTGRPFLSGTQANFFVVPPGPSVPYAAEEWEDSEPDRALQDSQLTFIQSLKFNYRLYTDGDEVRKEIALDYFGQDRFEGVDYSLYYMRIFDWHLVDGRAKFYPQHVLQTVICAYHRQFPPGLWCFHNVVCEVMEQMEELRRSEG